MHQDLYEKYEYLMNRLYALPDEIATAQRMENSYIQASGGWAGLGKNDSERKIVVQQATGGAPVGCNSWRRTGRPSSRQRTNTV